MADPFLKFVGGKRSLLPKLRELMPAEFKTYHEPFVGGGALFFDLAPKHAVLSDVNEPLIEIYKAIAKNVDLVIEHLRNYEKMSRDRGTYEKLRAEFNTCIAEKAWGNDRDTASQFAAAGIYINKTCFNGMWRVNKAGAFNVPFGDYASPNVCDENTLCAASARLGGNGRGGDTYVSLFTRDFRVGNVMVPGDFVYFDPPYVPVSKTSNFVNYSAGGFSFEDQTALRDWALHLKRRGVHVMLSNSGADEVRRLYEKDFELHEVACRRNINSVAAKRGEVQELIIR